MHSGVMSPIEFAQVVLGLGASVMAPESNEGAAWVNGRPVAASELERLARRRIRKAEAEGDPRVAPWRESRVRARERGRAVLALRPLREVPLSAARVPPRRPRSRRARRIARKAVRNRAGPDDGPPAPPQSEGTRRAPDFRGAP